jgi:hypothetical protein
MPAKMEFTMVVTKSQPLTHFKSHDDQERKDLRYGAQSEPCKVLAASPPGDEDTSLSGDWSPEED